MDKVEKVISAKDDLVAFLRGMGGQVEEKNGLLIVQGLEFGIDDKGTFLYKSGLTFRPEEHHMIAVQVGKEIYLY